MSHFTPEARRAVIRLRQAERTEVREWTAKDHALSFLGCAGQMVAIWIGTLVVWGLVVLLIVGGMQP